MITRDFINAGTGFSVDIPQPQAFAQPGKYYPTKYNNFKENGKFYVTLSHFVLR
jgi:hypothetical protein